MLADLRDVANGLDEPFVYVPWMRARESYSLQALNPRNALEQLCEVAPRIVWRLVVIHDLSQQLHFPMPRSGRLPDFVEDVSHRTHAFVAARVRHHAEGAEVVAALDDVHVGLDGIGAARDSERKRDIIMRVDVDCGMRVRPRLRLFHEHRQHLEALRAQDDVDIFRALAKRGPFLLRNAAGDGEHGTT